MSIDISNSDSKQANSEKAATEFEADIKKQTSKVTKRAATIQKIQLQIAQVPEVDVSRILQMQAAIANGSYNVDAVRLARKLLEFEINMKSER